MSARPTRQANPACAKWRIVRRPRRELAWDSGELADRNDFQVFIESTMSILQFADPIRKRRVWVLAFPPVCCRLEEADLSPADQIATARR